MTYEHYLTGKGLSRSTVKWYGMYAMDFISWLDRENTDPDEATATDVTGYLQRLKEKGQANITRRNSLIAIRHFFAYRVQCEARETNPAEHIKIRGIKQRLLYPTLSTQELENIYHTYSVPEQTAKESYQYTITRLSRQRNKVILGLMIWQGVTTAEVNDLSVADLKLREGKLYISGSRTSNERTLELKPQQVIELMEYQLQTRQELMQYSSDKEDKKLFLPSPACGKKAITSNNTVNIWKRLSQDIKADHPRFINFLQVRASVISLWLKHYNLRQVQYMAGHRYVSSTEAYQVNNIEELQEDINKYHPIG